MVRALLVALCFGAAVSGCQSVPLQPATTPPLPPPHTITVFTEVAPKRDAVKEAVLDHVPPGTSMAQAQELLKAQGFDCRLSSAAAQFFTPRELIPNGVVLESGAYQRISKACKDGVVYCQATRHELQEWHLRSYTVLVVLVPDHAQLVHDVEVGIAAHYHMQEHYFKTHSELREPIGLPVAAAQAQLEAAGFRCKAVVPKADAKEPRPHVLCEAYDENPIGGQIVRIRLFGDAAGVVREANVQDHDDAFDAERCMLPHGDASPAEVAWRSALFPVRAGCRYTLFAIALGMAITAMPYGLH
jgi:hypothetical protein